MIYILSGIAKSGKTLISNDIVEKHQIKVFSTDYIMMMLSRGNPSLNIDTHASDTSVARMIEPYVYGMIKTMIENGDTYFIEGVHFTTSFAKKLEIEFQDQINIIYIGYKDVSLEEKVKEFHTYKHTMNNPWLFHLQGTTVEDITLYMINESKRIYKECLEHNLKYIDIYNISIQKEEIINQLLKKPR